ncbi:unnamed protein product [Adineta ricciae]|uniref:Eukaryotic translation initiation factor 6 n=1 Tax=Adineta ricciae TaxID=249248 RepID=A0A814HUD6_ADIRI|nr:unnamed protein product [Adineta ricciae]
MAVRTQFESSNDIGVFTRLTNAYCLVGIGGSENFYSTFESELSDQIPVVHTSIGDCRVVGRLTVGNRHGLLVPSSTTDRELQHIRNSLPDNVRIKRCEERLSALGNVIACNDYVALVHPDLDKETEQILIDTLNVECFRQTIADRVLVGSYSIFSNQGGLLHPKTSIQEQEELSSLLQVPLVAGTVNRDTTAHEISVIENVFKLGQQRATGNKATTTTMKDSLVDALSLYNTTKIPSCTEAFNNNCIQLNSTFDRTYKPQSIVTIFNLIRSFLSDAELPYASISCDIFQK